MTSADTVYTSRIDAWLTVLLLGTMGIVLFQCWSSYDAAPRESLLAGIATIVTVTLLLALSWPCTYTLTESHLVIRSGLVRWRIPYRDIVGVRKSRSVWAGPALSLQRVKVSLHGRFMLVSPRDREQFITELARRAGLDCACAHPER
jgi:hypothetical protein